MLTAAATGMEPEEGAWRAARGARKGHVAYGDEGRAGRGRSANRRPRGRTGG